MLTTTTTRTTQKQRDRWRKVGVLVGGLALLATLGAQLILLMPTTYTATSAVSLHPLVAEQAADTIELRAHEMSVILGAKESAAGVLDELTPTSASAVEVTATRDPGTTTVRIESSSTNRDVAVGVANGLADRAVELSGEDEMVAVVVSVRAGDAGVRSGPPRQLYFSALVTVVALLLGGGLYQIREQNR